MNTPRASSDAVAELAMAHMLSCARFISVAGHTMREGKWEKKAYKGIEIHGKTLGIIGFGRIGQALGRMAKGMGMNVIAFDISIFPASKSRPASTMLKWTSCLQNPISSAFMLPQLTAAQSSMLQISQR